MDFLANTCYHVLPSSKLAYFVMPIGHGTMYSHADAQ